jgi:hypothetical protein
MGMRAAQNTAHQHSRELDIYGIRGASRNLVRPVLSRYAPTNIVQFPRVFVLSCGHDPLGYVRIMRFTWNNGISDYWNIGDKRWKRLSSFFKPIIPKFQWRRSLHFHHSNTPACPAEVETKADTPIAYEPFAPIFFAAMFTASKILL